MRLRRWTVLGMCASGAFCTPREAPPLRAAAETSAPDVPGQAAHVEAQQQPASAAETHEPHNAEPSTSLGSPTNGSLRAGALLPRAGVGFRFNDRRNNDARYGTDEVVAAIARAAERVHEQQPGGELVINDLSLPGGGPIPHHGSHRAGRDADILFYLDDDAGNPIPSVGAPLDPLGVGFDFKDLATPADDVRVHLDSARTWRFVAALLADTQAVVQRIFVVEHVRALLLKEAARKHASAASIARFEEVTCQPSYPHDDHLHVRWFCSREDIAAGCEESAPIYPWHIAELSALDVHPVLAHAQRSAEPAPRTTQAEADRAVHAASPDPAVLAFLKRRKAWGKQPHPGRPYCR